MSAGYEMLRYKAAAIAVQEESRNVKEEGKDNRGPRIDVYKLRAHSPLSNGHDWCGFFVYFCLSEAGKFYNQPLPFIPEKLWTGGRFTKWAHQNPETIVSSGPYLPGDVYVMNWGHIGICVGQASGGVLQTVDGNQSSLGGGKSLRYRTRNVSDIRVVVRI